MGDLPDGLTRCIASSVVSMMVMVLPSLTAAALYGAGAAMEQRKAAAAPQSSAGRHRLLFQLARQPLWLLGIAVQIGGFAAHAVALRSGSLATVQMVVSGEFVVAVVIVRIWSGRPLGRASWAAALTVVASIAVFLALTAPTHGHAAGQPEHAAAMVLAATATGGAALAAAAVGLRAAGRRRAVLLAVAAGLADACSAVVTMGFSHAAGHGLTAIFTSSAGYAGVACGAANVLLTQSAYQTGRPILTLPIITAVTPVASVAVGIGLLGETPRIGLPGAVGAGLAVLVTSLALARLAYCAPHPQVAHPEPKRMGPTGRERIGLPSMAALGSLDACGSRDRDGGPGPQRPGRRGGRLISRVRAMKFSLWPDNDRPPAELLDEVRAAEAAGWHGVWLADHSMPTPGDETPAAGQAAGHHRPALRRPDGPRPRGGLADQRAPRLRHRARASGQAGEPVRGGDHDRPVDARAGLDHLRRRVLPLRRRPLRPQAGPVAAADPGRHPQPADARHHRAPGRRVEHLGNPRAGRRPPGGSAGGLRQGRPRPGHDADLGQRLYRPGRGRAAGRPGHALRFGRGRSRPARAG